jgi:hypothetical protein
MLDLITLPLLAFMNRVRGGLFEEEIRELVPYYGTTISRILYGISIASAIIILGGSPLLATIAIATTWLGHAIAPFAPFQFMERSNDLLTMSLRGAILTGATGVAIMALHSVMGGLLFAVGGLLMGPVYLLGAKLPVMPFLNDNPATSHTNDTSEVLFGLLTSVLLILSI